MACRRRSSSCSRGPRMKMWIMSAKTTFVACWQHTPEACEIALCLDDGVLYLGSSILNSTRQYISCRMTVSDRICEHCEYPVFDLHGLKDTITDYLGTVVTDCSSATMMQTCFCSMDSVLLSLPWLVQHVVFMRYALSIESTRVNSVWYLRTLTCLGGRQAIVVRSARRLQRCLMKKAYTCSEEIMT